MIYQKCRRRVSNATAVGAGNQGEGGNENPVYNETTELVSFRPREQQSGTGEYDAVWTDVPLSLPATSPSRGRGSSARALPLPPPPGSTVSNLQLAALNTDDDGGLKPGELKDFRVLREWGKASPVIRAVMLNRRKLKLRRLLISELMRFSTCNQMLK